MEISNHFRSLEDLIRALDREQGLLKDMFYNRKTLSYRYETARELAKRRDESLEFLRKYGVIRIEGDFVEMEDVYLRFFEDVLVVNEDINVASVKQYIDSLCEAIEYHQSETSAQRKQKYLNDTKRILRNIALAVLRNVIDLKRNIDNTYKNEPTYTIKKKKLERLDEKRRDISVFIKETERIIDDRYTSFFMTAMDEYLQDIVTDVKYQLHEAYHNLIELDKQIINYLNLIEYQNRLIQKIQKLKHLRDQLILDTHTDIKSILSVTNPVWMEPRPRYQLKVSLSMLRNTEQGLRTLNELHKGKGSRRRHKGGLAEPLSLDDMTEQPRNVSVIDLQKIKDAFIATGDNLLHFVMNYTNQGRKLDTESRLVLFCQIATQYIDELDITGQYETITVRTSSPTDPGEDVPPSQSTYCKQIEYPLIYPKR